MRHEVRLPLQAGKYAPENIEPMRGFPGPGDGAEVDAVLVGVGFDKDSVIQNQITPKSEIWI